jgi:hypothetical protein
MPARSDVVLASLINPACGPAANFFADEGIVGY